MRVRCAKPKTDSIVMIALSGRLLIQWIKDHSLGLLVIALLASTQSRLVYAEAFADPVGDVFDREGRTTAAESYLDIVEVEVVKSGAEYTARIKVNGPLPSSLADPTAFLEWDLMLDIDQNPGTHPWGPWALLDNGIGVDLLVRLMLGPSGQGYRAEVFNVATRKGTSIDFRIDGATVQLKFDDKSLNVASPLAFDCVFTARKYGNYGRSGSELALDKAPNQGYFTFSDGKMSLISTSTATSTLTVKRTYEGPMTDAHAHAIQWSWEWGNDWGRSWMTGTMSNYRKAGVDKVIFFDGYGALIAHKSRPSEIVPSLYVLYMNQTKTLADVRTALEWRFPWIGEALLRHWGDTNTPADDPIALQIYDLCAKYQAPITVHQDSGLFKGAYEELTRAVRKSPNCVFVFHGWWGPGGGHLTWEGLEDFIVKHPNIYIELAGRLEKDTRPGQVFLGGTRDDSYTYSDGRMREEWRRLFERYPERFINGFDLFTESAFTFDSIKMRVDYFRSLFGQIDQKAAEMINYKNVEDLLAKRVCLMNVSLSSESAKSGDMVTVTARLRSMGADSIRNETVAFFWEMADGRSIPIGEAKTDKSGLATLNYKIDAAGGTYWIVASHPESPSYSYRTARAQLTVNQPTTTVAKTMQVTVSTAISSSILQSNYAPYIVAGSATTVLILLLLRVSRRKKIELPQT